MKKESIFDNRTFLMVISAVMAFIAWLFVAVGSNDTKGKVITSVPVNMQEVDESIGKLGLSTLTTEQPKVSVKVEGLIYDIGNLDLSDVYVYPDISKVTSAGTHTVELKGEVVGEGKNITIKEIDPPTIQLKFDSLQSQTFDIIANLSGYSAPAEDYLIRDVSVTPPSVEVTGPAEDISRINRCIVKNEINQELTSTYSETLPISFLDADGNELDLKYVVSDVTEARVTVPILKKKVVPVHLDFMNVPEGFPIGQLKFDISNEKIEIAGPAEAIDKYREIPLGQIDIKTLDIGKTESFTVKLPTGFVNTNNIQSVLVQFNGEGMVRKKFNINDITIQNVPVNYTAKATTPEINDIQIVGPKDVVENMVAGDIIAVVDLKESSSITSGQVELPVKISVPKKGLVWAVGNYKAIVMIEEDSGTAAEAENTDEEKTEDTTEKEE